MKSTSWSWSFSGKIVGAASVLFLLWNVYPILAGMVGMVTALCMVAYWSQDAKASSGANRLNPEDFQRQLAIVEGSGWASKAGVNVEQETQAFAALHQNPALITQTKRNPIGTTADPESLAETFSVRWVTLASSTVLLISILAAVVHLRTTATMVLLLLVIMGIARRVNTAATLIASILAAATVALLFYQPIGSLWVTQIEDQISVTAFLVVSIIGSQLVGKLKRQGFAVIQDKI